MDVILRGFNTVMHNLSLSNISIDAVVSTVWLFILASMRVILVKFAI